MTDIRIRDYENADAEDLIGHHRAPHQSDHDRCLAQYLRMGFVKAYDAPPIFGVAYAVYTKAL
jgi:hypothetical protein